MNQTSDKEERTFKIDLRRLWKWHQLVQIIYLCSFLLGLGVLCMAFSPSCPDLETSKGLLVLSVMCFAMGFVIWLVLSEFDSSVLMLPKRK